jgi:DNA primase
MSTNQRENWVDYKELKERVTMEKVLARYGLLEKLRPSGANLVGVCPIHKGSNPRQFSVSLEKNAFNCFGNCKAGGNVLDFVAKMEKVKLREAALLLQNWFPSGAGTPASEEQDEARRDRTEKPQLLRKKKEEPKDDGRRTEAEADAGQANPPLKFELKNLDPNHSFFAERGIAEETVKLFGLGLCSRGMLAGRVAIPIRNEAGELVAYCGRAVSLEQIEEEGKYKLPPNFQKLAVVYNLHRLLAERVGQGQDSGRRSLILFESYLSVWRASQAGATNAAALMGSVLGPRQEDLIVDYLGSDGQAILCFDGDEDGRGCTDDCLLRLGRKVFARALDIAAYARKPHQLTEDAFEKIFAPYI